ncbi:LTA synthase family protein [Sediminicola sp. YIK13]|uniref:LTA synthase family protein n=1 Tax=Sediminicola sp. YIK13 TaxID=1453352 RepID=UPI000784581E|nr:LTA synthase family protein [Sediminicola sp. YIK13]
MQVEEKITKHVTRKTLREYTRLVIAFFGCLVVISCYQFIRLYLSGVLDVFVGKSLLLQLFHHLGYASLVGLILVFGFNFLESRKPNFGFVVTSIILVIGLLTEVLLTEYYLANYEILEVNILSLSWDGVNIWKISTIVLMAIISMLSLFFLFYKITAKAHRIISKMYPLTIVFFSLFLAALASEKKPINENKTQHLTVSLAEEWLDLNKYDGKVEFPLLQPTKIDDRLGVYFDFRAEKPNIVILILDGLGSDFLGKDPNYKGFTPYLESLKDSSLFWSNYVSNVGQSSEVLPSIIGSLPFGKKGFTNTKISPERNTLYSILKANGYYTSFNYGGNSSINFLDRFLYEERVDYILDRKNFDDTYELQKEDAAGVSLGYPDRELFKKYNTDFIEYPRARFDVIQTLSTKNPSLIPNLSYYEDKVDRILEKVALGSKSHKIVENNKEIFAGLYYTDQSIELFFKNYKKKRTFKNTIFIITGTHNLSDLPHENNLDRYRVPLLIYSPLLKHPKQFNSLSSHADLAPSILALLSEKYKLDLPSETAWLGSGLVNNSMYDKEKKILFLREKNNIREYIQGDHFISRNSVYKLGTDMVLKKENDEQIVRKTRDGFRNTKAINSYLNNKNKIIPTYLALFKKPKNEFSKQEQIWVNSVFSGADFDNAYSTARDLALNNERDRAMLLSRYILTKIPGHADTEILLGRVNAWNEAYGESIAILKEVIRKYPTYSDGYSALLDVYFWSDKNQEALLLIDPLRKHNIKSPDVIKKMTRAMENMKQETLENPNEVYFDYTKIKAYLDQVAIK